jgi:hypothetical protein
MVRKQEIKQLEEVLNTRFDNMGKARRETETQLLGFIDERVGLLQNEILG